MSSVLSHSRPAIRDVAIAVSAGLFLYLVWHAGPFTLWRDLQRLGWGFSLVILLAGVSHLAKTWAWQMTIGKERHKIAFPRLAGLRLGAEAAGQLGILGQTLGDSIRVSHLGREIEMGNSLASVTLDRGLYLVTGVTIAIAGLLAGLSHISLSHVLRFYAGVFILAAAAFLLLTLMALRMRWPLLTGTARLLRRVPSLKEWIEQRFELIASMENALFDFHHRTPALFWGSFSLNLATQFLAILEVCLVLRLLGTNIGFFGGLIIEALTKLVNAVGNFNPGNLGTYEGGNMLIGKIFSLTNATGLALAFARRLRALFWTAVGGVCLLWLTRKSSSLHVERIKERHFGKTSEPPDGNAIRRSSTGAVTFVIALNAASANINRFNSPLARVGGLPILLRTILAVQKLSPAQVIVVADPSTRDRAQTELAGTGRLPAAVQWIDESADLFLPRRLSFAASQSGSHLLVLIDGNATYHPSLIRQANGWKASDMAMALTSRDQYVGIYAVPLDLLNELKADAAHFSVFEQLRASLVVRDSLISVEAGQDQWQRVSTEKERHTAEKKLDRWLIKPTDGMYAQLNRRISIPISRQLIKLPITANMVSIFTLGVGFCSAAFFALGGYWNTLVGAFLCLFASILDGCDGEVARLKLLESDFGCWLETVCDYVFYLFLLVGMTIGQVRSSGSPTYLVAGVLLLVGALASFLAVGRGRQRLAADRPEQFLGVWRTHAESRRSNPVLYIARHTEFMVRRCFFPYALCVFALLNIMNVAFVLSVIGANLVWPISLYSSRTFSMPRRAVVANPVASQ
jgi:phosphatidylglycerophosphate synthase